MLDVEYIHRLGNLNFVHEGKNLVIWGAPGTGKNVDVKGYCNKGLPGRNPYKMGYQNFELRRQINRRIEGSLQV